MNHHLNGIRPRRANGRSHPHRRYTDRNDPRRGQPCRRRERARPAIASSRPSQSASTRPRSRSMRRGVNALLTSARNRAWSGSSRSSMLRSSGSRKSGIHGVLNRYSGSIAFRRSFAKVPSFRIRATSSRSGSPTTPPARRAASCATWGLRHAGARRTGRGSH
jgi:hypothetical protein